MVCTFMRGLHLRFPATYDFAKWQQLYLEEK